MFNKTVYCILLCIVICTQGLWCLKPQNRKSSNSRIIGGGDEDIESNTHMAYLSIYKSNRVTNCGGTIVSNYSIITAAHCLYGAQTVKVRIGSAYSNSGGYEYLMTDFNMHPAYDKTTYDYDIGIVNVQDGMVLNGYTTSAIGVTPITNEPPAGEYMYITGWGPTTPGGEPSIVLQGAKVPVIDRTRCQRTYPGLTRRMYCAGKDNIKECGEDLGGPAVGQKNLLTGVASFSLCTSNSNHSTIFVHIGHPLIRTYVTAMTGV